MFDRDPITKVIAIESGRLRKKWVSFYQDCPKGERLDLKTSEPSLEGVTDTIREITESWQTKRKKSRLVKATAQFHRFSSTLSAHSSLLKVLPEGNEYVSVFTGTINAVIKVISQWFLILRKAKCSLGVRQP